MLFKLTTPLLLGSSLRNTCWKEHLCQAYSKQMDDIYILISNFICISNLVSFTAATTTHLK